MHPRPVSCRRSRSRMARRYRRGALLGQIEGAAAGGKGKAAKGAAAPAGARQGRGGARQGSRRGRFGCGRRTRGAGRGRCGLRQPCPDAPLPWPRSCPETAAPSGAGGTDITVPTLGESVSEATVAKWFKKAGDSVKADEPHRRTRNRQGDARGKCACGRRAVGHRGRDRRHGAAWRRARPDRGEWLPQVRRLLPPRRSRKPPCRPPARPPPCRRPRRPPRSRPENGIDTARLEGTG